MNGVEFLRRAGIDEKAELGETLLQIGEPP